MIYAVRAVDIHGNVGSLSPEVSIGRAAFSLAQNAPNPFNPSTTIRFVLPEAGAVRLSIYGADGRLVRSLVTSEFTAGSHEVVWDGTDNAGRACASGIYLCRLVTPAGALDRRMALVR